MIKKFTYDQYNQAKSLDNLLLECLFCKQDFLCTKRNIKHALLNSTKDKRKFCTLKCSKEYLKSLNFIICSYCNNKSHRQKALINVGNNFCTQSCAAKYNNAHKTKGTRRSKLEQWLEIKLLELYPDLEFHFNKTDAINAELDIYIPSLKLAFELNGIFHYEPIYGQDKLDKIQSNDHRKFQACIEHNISLCIIDTTSLLHFKENNAIIFLNILTSILNDGPRT